MACEDNISGSYTLETVVRVWADLHDSVRGFQAGHAGRRHTRLRRSLLQCAHKRGPLEVIGGPEILPEVLQRE